MNGRQRRKLFGGVGVIAMLLGVLMVVAPGVGATDPHGNNGTVKIDGRGLWDGPGHSVAPNDHTEQHPDMDPHVGCRFELEFFGFDEGQLADVEISLHAPTGNGQTLVNDEGLVISADPAGGAAPDPDVVLPYDLTDHLADVEPHAVHGWHVKLDLTIYEVNGGGQKVPVPGGQKHKVFWVEGCVPTLTVQKVVSPTPDGTGPSFEFTGPEGGTFTLGHGEAVTFVLDPGMYTVTESEGDGYDLDDVTCYSDYGTEGQQEFAETDVESGAQVTLAAGDDVTCVFVNVPEVTPAGGLIVAKVAGANAPVQSPTFSFRVDCDGVDLDPGSDATHAGFDLVFGGLKPFTDLPAGASCDVVETAKGGATSTTYVVNSGGATSGDTASDVVIPSGSDATVAFTNNYPASIVSSAPPLTYSVEIDKLNDADGDGDFSDVEGADAQGDAVAFEITIRNTGTGGLVLESLVDRVPGRGDIDLLDEDLDCGALSVAANMWMGPGAVITCTFVLEDYAPAGGDSLTNTVTVVTDRDSDSDTSTVDVLEIRVLPEQPVENPPLVDSPAETPPAVTPPGVTPPAVAPQQQQGPEVKGDVVTRTLPRTGQESRNLAGAGAFLVTLGAAMVLGSKRQLARR